MHFNNSKVILKDEPTEEKPILYPLLKEYRSPPSSVHLT